METTGSKRTPSRCREWERRRRNKFNDAISKLGEIVKAINKSNNPEAGDDVQYPKIEIIEKAIICLTNCAQEKTQLKAEILALHVKLDAEIVSKISCKDASTQVYFGFTKKQKDGKYVKLLKLKKNNKAKPEKKKPVLDKSKAPATAELSQKLPKLLPRLIDKKGPENTIVVLPAAPYIFPQRPLLFPPVPPTIVLVDQHLQPINKASVPIVNRNNGDITKTTMVNILPISAYSHPISVSKSKNKTIKLKNNSNKKTIKKPKLTTNVKKELAKTNIDSNKPSNNFKQPVAIDGNTQVTQNANKAHEKDKIKEMENVPNHKLNNSVTSNEITKLDQINNSKVDNTCNKNKIDEVPNVADKDKCTDSIVKDPPPTVIATSLTTKTSVSNKITVENSQVIKNVSAKETRVNVNKEKDKLPVLPLDSSLCENVVDTRNARLELAEEFLATSPTAAFLMSFPLVSGNRADSPTEDQHHNATQINQQKESVRRNELVTAPSAPYFEKPNTSDAKTKSSPKLDTCNTPSLISNKENIQQKSTVHVVVTKETTTNTTVTKSANANVPSVSNENPFLNLPLPSIITTSCSLADASFGIDFDCNISKSMPNQPTNYVSSNNFFYKSDPFGTVKSSIYSTSNITASHDFNGLSLYPCAMDKYTSKNKSDYSSMDENLMKIGTSRLTYDIDIGWSQKGLDFVNCTTTGNTFNKDTILTSTSAPYTSSYNPFNSDFHMPLVSTSNKKDINLSAKTNSSFPETIPSFYSQPNNLWTEDVPFYTNNNMSKSLSTKSYPSQNYPLLDHVQNHSNVKNSNKNYESKIIETNSDTGDKLNTNQHIPEKFTKKSPSKMHINWMTSETRSVQNNNGNPAPHVDSKGMHKLVYNHSDQAKKQDHNEGNYFPISMHNFSTQTAQEEFQVWPSTRPLGTTEISIDRLPINLPTLVGDLALGPHDKNKKVDSTNRVAPQADIQNYGNFLSVTQLMNRSSDITSRYQVSNIDASKVMSTKQSLNNFSNEGNRKNNMPYLDNHVPQPCYVYNDPKLMNSFENPAQYLHSKTKTNNKPEKPSKTHKNNYSTEALLKGANCTQKVQDNSSKLMMPTQKYPEFSSTQESAVAQVSHFPTMIDYTDNSYASQQFAGTTLYNTTTNTISNSFYSNFMPGSGNLMSSNYAGGTFSGDFIDYNQASECNYTNHKYEELKIRNNVPVYQSEKVPSNYKGSRRESATKHKLECSKKESSKKFLNKKAKITNDAEEWNDPSHLLWQNKTSSKKHPNLMSEDLPLPNYVGNQMASQYQPEFFNSHLMPTSVTNMGHNMDRSLATFPATSRANFNLSTIFPEITMKVQ